MSAAADQYLHSKGFDVLAATNLPPGVDALIAKLQPMAGRVARGSMTEGSQAALADLGGRLGSASMLAQYLRVRVGGKGSLNPIDGAITSGQRETLLAAALIRPAAGTVVWKHEVLIRKVLSPGSKELKEALGALYSTLGEKPLFSGGK